MNSETRTAALRRGWYPVVRAVDLDRPQKATLLGRRLVAFRTADGQPRVLPDRAGDAAAEQQDPAQDQRLALTARVVPRAPS